MVDSESKKLEEPNEVTQQPEISEEPNSLSRFDYAERIVKMASAFIIPIVVGLLAWQVNASTASKQQDSADQATEAQYVELAIDILSQPVDSRDPNYETSLELRKWAVALLQSSSPVVISAELEQSIIEGEVDICGSFDDQRADLTIRIQEELQESQESGPFIRELEQERAYVEERLESCLYRSGG